MIIRKSQKNPNSDNAGQQANNKHDHINEKMKTMKFMSLMTPKIKFSNEFDRIQVCPIESQPRKFIPKMAKPHFRSQKVLAHIAASQGIF